jgi:hypothetical protein
MRHNQGFECGCFGETPWPVLSTNVILIQVKDRGNVYRGKGENELDVKRSIEQPRIDIDPLEKRLCKHMGRCGGWRPWGRLVGLAWRKSEELQ